MIGREAVIGQGAATGEAGWTERFEGIARLPSELRDSLVRSARILSIPEGSRIFGPGHVPDHLLLLLDGVIRVSQLSESGREILLYRVEAGESCVLTTACLLAHQAHSAEGTAETDIEAVAIPNATFDHLMANSARFRDFVFSAYARRITDLFRVIDEVAFGKIDMRLADRLLQRAPETGPLRITHQALATELGTAREVVSRQFADWQRRGLIRLERGAVELLDRGALERIAQG